MFVSENINIPAVPETKPSTKQDPAGRAGSGSLQHPRDGDLTKHHPRILELCSSRNNGCNDQCDHYRSTTDPDLQKLGNANSLITEHGDLPSIAKQAAPTSLTKGEGPATVSDRVCTDGATLLPQAARAVEWASMPVGREQMAKDDHNKAAEHHENAAKSHRNAAEQHGKGDHSKGQQHFSGGSTEALEERA